MNSSDLHRQLQNVQQRLVIYTSKKLDLTLLLVNFLILQLILGLNMGTCRVQKETHSNRSACVFDKFPDHIQIISIQKSSFSEVI